MKTRNRGSDADLVRSAARRIAWQISIASALIVLVVAAATLLLRPVLHGGRQGRLEGGLGGDGGSIFGGDDDALLRDALIGAAIIGIALAGVVGFVVARRAVAPLGEALALQRRFIADAGHELRTPLTVLHTRAQLVARRMDPADPARPMVEQLLDDSRVLSEIVDEMLESAALSSDPSRGDQLDLGMLAAEVAASMQVLATGAGVSLQVVDGAQRGVRGSHSALRRAVTALVDNALSHTPPNGHVVIEVAEAGDRVLLTVTDDGEGFADGDADRLTERFARGQASMNSVGGGRRFGLGLSLVREVTTAHGGTFTLNGHSGAGARATIDLPAFEVDG